MFPKYVSDWDSCCLRPVFCMSSNWGQHNRTLEPLAPPTSEVLLLLRILCNKLALIRLDANAEVSRNLFQLKIANLKFTSYCTDRVCLCYFLSLVHWRLYQWPFQGIILMPIHHQYWTHLLGRLISFRDVCVTFKFLLISTFIFMPIPRGEVDYSGTTHPLPDNLWLLQFIPNLIFKDETSQPLQGSLDEN